MLTHRELKTIQEGNRRHPDVMTLLREVKRLREFVVQAHTMMRTVPMNQLNTDEVNLIEFFDALEAEPAVIEHERMRRAQEKMDLKRRQANQRSPQAK